MAGPLFQKPPQNDNRPGVSSESEDREVGIVDKIPTMFLRDEKNPRLVTRAPNPEAAWLFEADTPAMPTVKRDGTNVRVTVEGGKVLLVEKRCNPTRAEKALGAEPGYVPASRDDPADQHIFAAVDGQQDRPFRWWPNGAWPCEALGPKIQGGTEGRHPCLYPFSFEPSYLTWGGHAFTRPLVLPNYDTILDFFTSGGGQHIEGIVWHHPDGRMAKIKRRDFGLPWPARDEIPGRNAEGRA